jgi:signal transduction histidine kinase
MSNIVIPENLEKKITKGSFVYPLIQNSEKLLLKTPYFPEYTMHNEYHISSVLKLADELIPPATMNKLDGQSIEILIGAIILHDLGMFIEYAGLKRLLFGEHKDRCVNYLDKFTWLESWLNFYRKVQRYTDRQLIRLFGNTSHVEKLPFDNVAEGNYLLYGEFLRQNHARLAYDITQIGFPGNNIDIDVFEKCTCDNATKTMIGIIARSHGMKLRDTEDFLKNYEFTLNIPHYYLMVVLRIADILHCGQKRAPEFAELKNNMHSPESERQFHLNQAIIDGPTFDFELKSVHIIADPNCSSTYEDVEKLLFSIQQELDYCWAVLAEKYSYKYELSIHRILSNLSDENKVAAFNKRFLTRRVTLNANPDIAKLLIEPLYGNNPSYGVRELIQNAVDACNERTAIDDRVIDKIVVRVDTKRETFDITDNGMGMTEDILKNYFLVAGSSYRYSDLWLEKYTDDDRKAKIIKSGRFGIGALASFLIGDEITVTTRHMDDELGFQFTYTLEPKVLNIIRVNTDIGTRIEIKKLHKRTLKYFQPNYLFKNYTKHNENVINTPWWYQWYHFSKPKVYYYFNENQVGEDKFIIPDQGIDKDGWYNVKSDIFQNMKLSFTGGYGNIFVNGIIINNQIDRNFEISEYGFDIETPRISLIDLDNSLEINLNRTRIINFPEKSLIAENTYKYYLARLLILPISNISILAKEKMQRNHFVLSSYGFTLSAPSFIYHTKQKRAILLLSGNNKILSQKILSNTPIAILHDDYFRYLYETNDHFFIDKDYVGNNCCSCWYKILPWHEDRGNLFRDDPSRLHHDLGDDCYHVTFHENKPEQLPFELELSEDLPIIIEYVPENPCETDDENIMLHILHEYLPNDVNNGWIPFDIEERKKLYPKAFSELKRYMDDM